MSDFFIIEKAKRNRFCQNDSAHIIRRDSVCVRIGGGGSICLSCIVELFDKIKDFEIERKDLLLSKFDKNNKFKRMVSE